MCSWLFYLFIFDEMCFTKMCIGTCIENVFEKNNWDTWKIQNKMDEQSDKVYAWEGSKYIGMSCV